MEEGIGQPGSKIAVQQRDYGDHRDNPPPCALRGDEDDEQDAHTAEHLVKRLRPQGGHKVVVVEMDVKTGDNAGRQQGDHAPALPGGFAVFDLDGLKIYDDQ